MFPLFGSTANLSPFDRPAPLPCALNLLETSVTSDLKNLELQK